MKKLLTIATLMAIIEAYCAVSSTRSGDLVFATILLLLTIATISLVMIGVVALRMKGADDLSK